MLRKSLDPSENLPEPVLRQVAFGQLGDNVPCMQDETPAGRESPLLEARQGPSLDGESQDKPAQESAEMVGA